MEGAYYVWKYDELASVLDEDEFEGARRVFGLSPGGNFEDGASVLALQPGVPWEERDTPVIAALRRRLLDLRAEKERPRRDEKVLTSWNALAIEALCRGYRALGDGRYLDAALRAAEFIKANLYRDGVLYRRYMEGDVRHGGTLDDYVYTIQGFITLYESTFDSGWLGLAARLQETQNELFADEAGGYHYTPRDAEHLIARVKDFFDGAMPNSNAVSALNLLRLHRLTRDDAHLGRALGVFGASAALMRTHPSAFSQMLIALDFYLAPPFEAVIAGEPSSGEFIRTAGTLRRSFSPSLVIAAGDEGVPMAGGKQLHGKALIYLCRDTACDAPTADVGAVLAALDGVNRYSLDE
ncbi:MAG: thioredoxin domain-containing protein [Spirochaetota bacterium]